MIAKQLKAEHVTSVRLCCSEVGISEACYYYQPKLSDENDDIADWLISLTQSYKRWGFDLCFDYLRSQGFTWNHKRVYRIYCELALNKRIKPRRRIKRDKPDALSVPTAVNQVWSIDVGLLLPSERVIRGLEQIYIMQSY